MYGLHARAAPSLSHAKDGLQSGNLALAEAETAALLRSSQGDSAVEELADEVHARHLALETDELRRWQILAKPWFTQERKNAARTSLVDGFKPLVEKLIAAGDADALDRLAEAAQAADGDTAEARGAAALVRARRCLANDDSDGLRRELGLIEVSGTEASRATALRQEATLKYSSRLKEALAHADTARTRSARQEALTTALSASKAAAAVTGKATEPPASAIEKMLARPSAKRTAPIDKAERATVQASGCTPEDLERALPPGSKLAVLHFRSNVRELQGPALRYFEGAVRSTALEVVPRLSLITPENMALLASAAGKDLSQCEGSCEVETGRLIQADAVITGNVVRVGDALKLTLALHETHETKQLRSAMVSGETIEDLDQSAGRAARQLFGAR
jgi:hypothetical protein